MLDYREQRAQLRHADISPWTSGSPTRVAPNLRHGLIDLFEHALESLRHCLTGGGWNGSLASAFEETCGKQVFKRNDRVRYGCLRQVARARRVSAKRRRA
jgi:hypothetical protein